MKIQKRLAAKVLGTSPNKVKFDQSRLVDIKEAITKTDIRNLVSEKAITKKNVHSASRAGARKNKVQKSKDLRKNQGSREGKKGARQPRKEAWMAKIRKQRMVLKELKQKGLITDSNYRDLYYKSKGGFFRSKRHLMGYMEDKELFKKNNELKK